jgi:uncharacterized protein YkwD
MLAARALIACALTLVVLGCGGGGGGSSDNGQSSGTGATGVPPISSGNDTAPTPSASPSPTTTPAPTPNPNPARSGNALYDRTPIVSSCDAGELKQSEKTLALDKLNAIRALHRLAPVSYDLQADIQTSKSALISVANAKLTHTPTTGDKCYTAEGKDGSGLSNLYISYSSAPRTLASDSAIVGFLIDDGVASLGHRRWLLHPFLSRTSFGRVDGAPLVSSQWSYVTGMSLKVIGFPAADLSSSSVEYIAYPEGDYPSAYFKHGWFMSFTVLANKTSSFANGSSAVDFSGATVEVRDAGNALLAVSEQSTNYSGFGIPNALQWKAAGTVNNVQYTVNVRAVKVGGVAKDYQYVFRIQ